MREPKVPAPRPVGENALEMSLINDLRELPRVAETHPIEVAVYLDPQEIVLLVVNDGLDPGLGQPLQDNKEAILDEQGLEELGLFLVHQVMDTVTYERQQGCNVVVMTKRRPSKVESETESG